jgi:hypothetical protein
MRHDAREQAQRRPHAVTVARGCCATRTVSIRHAAHRRADVLQDGYVLRIKTKGDRVLGLAVSETVIEAEQTPHLVHRDATLEYALERSTAATARWRGRLSIEEVGTTQGDAGEPSTGTGFSKECSLRLVPRRVYVDMLAIVRNARQHVSSLTELSHLPSCR